ncbi:pro-neuregulin-3, membrane-bound isoform isoform X4 [Eublepharis macularius]|uniref:Pro-neuregulin-3, membrane-bound isoform n=1 Tax=Eublepharis macularius TaxID=481883 RepID=A0AA97JI06_EUBMA|nr:pro-neuregulin-3, membrane-bound isoform isoform X4 [Eublepharis macularius]
MSEGPAAPPGAAAAAEEGAAAAAAGGPAAGDGGPAAAREVRCSDCIVWNRQQTWLCVVPLFIGFVGLGLSLMLLKWIVVGAVKEYVPPQLMDSKGIEQDPFFLSKPSALPKSMETTTTTTAAAAASSRTPNRISTRLTTMTRAPTRFPGTRGPIRASSPRSATPRHPAGPPTALAPTAPLGTTLLISRPAPGTPGTQPLPLWPTAAYTTSSYKTYLQDSAPSWTLSPFQEASSTTTAAPEASSSPKHHTTTYSTEQSEHFKPCKDKDLAYCLNDGECFVIETLTGSHKHCRCKEGYQGVRCDQFLPKTDSILSDPSHLGIEFMESEEIYQRQVLSISCIVFGIVIVGMICAAFYFKTKKQAKHIQEQLKEMQNGRTYSLNAPGIVAKPEARAQSRVQLQNYSKANKPSEPVMGKTMESTFSGTPSFPESLSPDRGSQPMRPHSRSLSSCCSPGQRTGIMLHRNAFRRTPPLPRGRFSGITGPAYQQLEESRIPDQDMIPCQGFSSSGLKTQHNASINMQLPSRERSSYFNDVVQKDMAGYPSPRASSVPIIPSVGLEEAYMQTQNVSDPTGLTWCKNSYSTELVNVSAPARSCLIAEQQEVKILLETVQKQIRILTDARRSEDLELASADTENSTSENTAFLPMSPLAKLEREAQFVLKSETQRDSTLIK